jgi:hypothetical protein
MRAPGPRTGLSDKGARDSAVEVFVQEYRDSVELSEHDYQGTTVIAVVGDSVELAMSGAEAAMLARAILECAHAARADTGEFAWNGTEISAVERAAVAGVLSYVRAAIEAGMPAEQYARELGRWHENITGGMRAGGAYITAAVSGEVRQVIREELAGLALKSG